MHAIIQEYLLDVSIPHVLLHSVIHSFFLFCSHDLWPGKIGRWNFIFAESQPEDAFVQSEAQQVQRIRATSDFLRHIRFVGRRHYLQGSIN